MNIGYARVSTNDQDETGQIAMLRAADCQRIYVDHASGKDLLRPEWEACRQSLKSGDSLVVVRLDRLGRSLIDLIQTIDALGELRIEFRSLTESLDTSTPAGRMMFQIVGAFGEYERSLIRERTREGLLAAQSRGARIGRPPALSQEQAATVKQLRDEGRTIASIARIFEVSRRTIQRTLVPT